MKNEYLVYLQEILDSSWVVELISEQFDDAVNMMTTNSIIYGGAVRDCIAGKTLLGDLDIAVSSAEYHVLVSRFIKSPKWVLINRSQKNAIDNAKNFPRYKLPNPFLPVNDSHLYENSKISGTTSFRTLGNKIVQIMGLSTSNNTPFQTVIHFAKQVDMVCCGIILTSNGKVFEVVPNAYSDCKKNILCLNKTSDINNLERFQSRIEKLVKRGWNNSINMNQIIKKKRKNLNEINHNEINHKNIRFNYAKTETSIIKNNFRYNTLIPNDEIVSFGGKAKLFPLLDHLAKAYQLDIIIQSRFDDILMKTIDKITGRFVYRKIFGIKKKSAKPFLYKTKNGEYNISTDGKKMGYLSLAMEGG